MSVMLDGIFKSSRCISGFLLLSLLIEKSLQVQEDFTSEVLLSQTTTVREDFLLYDCFASTHHPHPSINTIQ